MSDLRASVRPISPATREGQGSWRNGAHVLVTSALVGLLATTCGIQAHPTAPTDDGSGGQPASTGGHASGGVTGSGGNGSGGVSASGGAIGSGGQSSGSGGGTGTGGGASSGGSSGTGGSGGSTASTGGSTASTGGSTASTGGSPASSGGSTGSGGSTSSGAGVMINGQFVPKEKAVAFIHFGHSNMRGQATKPTSLMSYFYNTVPGLWSYKGSFTLAKEPTAPETNMTYAGPGMAILHSAQAAVASNSDVQFISIGYGIGSKTSVDYLKATNTYYPIFMKWAGQLKGNVTFGAIIIMLGITDGEHLPTDQVPGFPGRIQQIVSDIRADLGEPNLPVMFCDYEQMATGTLAPTGSVGVVMQPLVRMLPGLIDKLVLVPTDNLEMQDDHHFDMQGHKDWANRLVMLMQSNNWFPWK